MGCGDICFGNVSDEFLLNAVGRGAPLWHEAEAVADAEYVRIDSHGGLIPYDGLHDIGCLAADTRQTDQFF